MYTYYTYCTYLFTYAVYIYTYINMYNISQQHKYSYSDGRSRISSSHDSRICGGRA